MEVDLLFYRDTEYIGDVYLGFPNNQRATVVLDTGSSWLNVKGCLYEKKCHAHSFQKKPENEWPKYLSDYRKKVLKNENNKNGVSYRAYKSKTYSATDKKPDFKLGYGSASLTGWRSQDYVCLRKLPANLTERDLSPKIMRENYCVKDIRFMTIMTS